MAAVNVAPEYIGMVNRQEAVFLEVTGSFRDAVGKKRPYFIPVVSAAAYPAGTIQGVGAQHPRARDMRHVELVTEQRRGQALVGRDAVKRDTRRRLKTGGASVAHF